MQQLVYNKETRNGITTSEPFPFRIIPTNKRNKEISFIWMLDEYLFAMFVSDYFEFELYEKKCDELTLDEWLSFTSDKFEILVYPVTIGEYNNAVRVDIRSLR